MLTEILSILSKTDFTHYQSTSTSRLLFDIQMWLIANRHGVVIVDPIDSFASWKFQILLPDIMSPFFEPEYDKFNEYSTYEDALEAGIYEVVKSMPVAL